MTLNGYFKNDDPHSSQVAGIPIHGSWWSRMYEYPWAFQFAGPGQVVADMGCGYTFRPFKEMLASTCDKVYAVDKHKEVIHLIPLQYKIQILMADFTQGVPEIQEGSLDRIFCLSVMEECIDYVEALKTFSHLLKPDGKIVLTFDVIADPSKPTGIYHGVNLNLFFIAIKVAGLRWIGGLDLSMGDRLTHGEWNLAVFHMVLMKTENPQNEMIKLPAQATIALDWVDRALVPGKGIAAWIGAKTYPEVSGYIIPTMIAYGRPGIAYSLARWLEFMYHDGEMPNGLDSVPRSFDASACVEGLEIAAGYFGKPEFMHTAKLIRNLIEVAYIKDGGRIYASLQDNTVHNYSLRVNGLFNIFPTWLQRELRAWPFGQGSERVHYLAYALEGLLMLGEDAWVRELLEEVDKVIADHEDVCAFSCSPHWENQSGTCLVATAQIGWLLAKLNMKPELRKRLMEGLFAAIDYHALSLSWEAKWFLDFVDLQWNERLGRLLVGL
jgi:hypothetical protein